MGAAGELGRNEHCTPSLVTGTSGELIKGRYGCVESRALGAGANGGLSRNSCRPLALATVVDGVFGCM